MRILRYLSLLFICISPAWALGPIEGGTEVTDKNSKSYLKFIHQIKWKDRSPGKRPDPNPTCTTTQIAPEWFLTAAHCVIKAGKKSIVIEGFQVIAAIPHPEYVREEAKGLDPCLECIKFDVGLIKVKPLNLSETEKYPAVISPTTTFKERKNINLAGFGTKKIIYNGSDFEASEAGTLNEGNNTWEECDSLKQKNPVEAFVKDMDEVLYFSSERVHHINGKAPEGISFDSLDNFESGKASFLPGDSGSSVFEVDSTGKFVITGIASSMQNFLNKRQIELTNDKSEKEIIDVPDEILGEFNKAEWAAQKNTNDVFREIILEQIKKSTKFPELKKATILPDNFTIFRLQNRTIKNHVTNLAAPSIQTFLRNAMLK